MSNKSTNKPVAFSSLFKSKNSELGTLCQHAAFLSDIEKNLLSFLGFPLNTHCKLANYANDTVILHSDSPAWAAKLRYNTPLILDLLRTRCRLNTLKTIRIKVNPPVSPASTLPVKRLTLSPASAEFISQVANSMTDDNLRLSLLKIAKHIKT